MAKEKAPKENQEQAQEGGKKKGKKLLLLIIIAVVVLVAGGGAAYFFVFKGGGEKKENAQAKKESKDATGVNFSFEPFVVNLMDSGGTKYLKVSIQIELADAKLIEKAKARTPQLRDAVITLLSTKTSEELISSEGKIILKDEIKQRANQILGEGTVLNVYLTEFVMQ